MNTNLQNIQRLAPTRHALLLCLISSTALIGYDGLMYGKLWAQVAPAEGAASHERKRGFSITVDGVDVLNDVIGTSRDNARGIDPIKVRAVKPDDALPKTLVLPSIADVRSSIATPTKSLDNASIKISFDGGVVEPTLVAHAGVDKNGKNGQPLVRFSFESNYTHWIKRSELLVYHGQSGTENATLAHVFPVQINRDAVWKKREEGPLFYVLRVYDHEGRFDETVPKQLFGKDDGVLHQRIAPKRNIPIHGGTVTIIGSDLPDDAEVKAFNDTLKVHNGQFLLKRIMPAGEHNVTVSIAEPSGQILDFARDINIPDNEWFYVGLADFSLGHRIERIDGGNLDEVYTKGRLSFYLKGKIKGQYLLTAAADTQDGEIGTMHRRLNQKNSENILKRIDPDSYYPVYGDGSTSVDDAPTSGNLYVRLEKGDSHVMWGDYRTSISGTRLLNHSRELYGAQGVYKSDKKTKDGNSKVEVEAYAAQPDSLPQREYYSATGGSVYFLKRQDIIVGSDVVRQIIRDDLSGRIIKTIILQRGKDYTINTTQGLITLAQPLSAIVKDDAVIREGANGTLKNSLQINYEYTPLTSDVDGFAYGGRAAAWINDRLRVGITGHKEDVDIAQQQAFGADFHLRFGEKSWLEGEYAQSRGTGFGTTFSDNGGFSIDENASSGRLGQAAGAYSFHGHIALSDIDEKLSGNLGFYYDSAAAGFSTLNTDIDVARQIWGVSAEIDFSKRLTAKASFDQFDDDNGKARTDGAFSIRSQYNDDISLEIGLKATEQTDPIHTASHGRRVDGGGKITYKINENTALNAFAQGTLASSGTIARNDRYGIGAEHKLSDKLTLSGEISHGTDGAGGNAKIAYAPNENKQYYIGYELDPTRVFDTAGRNLGAFVAGAKQNHNDEFSTYIESKYDHFGNERSIISSHGATYKPTDEWRFSGQYETGKNDRLSEADFRRNAISASAGYTKDEDFKANLRAEIRMDDSQDIKRQRDTYMLLGGLSVRVSDDWVLKADGQAIHSTTDQNSIANGQFYKANIGYAYRPTKNDRFNALLRYTYLYDLPAADQVTLAGTTLGLAQNSHIISADGTYRLNDYLSIGGKYGYRLGEVSQTRLAEDFTPSSAHLGILRADINVVKKWDLLGEVRMLRLPQAEQTYYGGLTAVYRHVGDNIKVGAGYNFGKFSDDLADLTLDNEGTFLNVIGKF